MPIALRVAGNRCVVNRFLTGGNKTTRSGLRGAMPLKLWQRTSKTKPQEASEP